MIATRALSTEQLRHLFGRISRDGQTFSAAAFEAEFANVEFSGKQLITTPRAEPAGTLASKGRKGAGKRAA